MQNLVAAAGIFPGSRAGFEKGALVAGQQQQLLASGPGISGFLDRAIEGRGILHYFGLGAQMTGESRDNGMVGHLGIHIYMPDRHVRYANFESIVQ